MQPKSRSPEETYGPAVQKAELAFPQLDPRQAAMRAAVVYKDGIFQIPFFGRLHHVGWPQASVVQAADQSEVDIASRILLLHYILTADGTPIGAEWNDLLYRPHEARALKQPDADIVEVALIPYYSWANRGLSRMEVWVPLAR